MLCICGLNSNKCLYPTDTKIMLKYALAVKKQISIHITNKMYFFRGNMGKKSPFHLERDRQYFTLSVACCLFLFPSVLIVICVTPCTIIHCFSPPRKPLPVVEHTLKQVCASNCPLYMFTHQFCTSVTLASVDLT